MEFVEAARRLLAQLRREWAELVSDAGVIGRDSPPPPDGDRVEFPWRHRWEHLPKRTAGFGFSAEDYRAARVRAEEIARLTLGEELWTQVRREGHVDLPSRRFPGVTYRLRVGRRIEVRCAPGVRPPWPQPYLCINPTYPLPEAEFFAHLYLYARDHEDELVRVAAPQPWDQALGRTF
jgi:hypothetical protein